MTDLAATHAPWYVGLEARGDFYVVAIALADGVFQALRPQEARDLAAALIDMAERCER